MAHEVTVVTLQVLNEAEDGAHEDKRAPSKHHPHVLHPGHGACACHVGRVPQHAEVEQARHRYEEPERRQLYEKAGDDDVLALLHLLEIISHGELGTASPLQSDWGSVGDDEDLRHPIHGQGAQAVGLEHAHDTG